MSHNCNTYCHDDVHAVRLLRCYPQDEVAIRQDYEALGLEVLWIRPVHEVDLDEWRSHMTHYLGEEAGAVLYEVLDTHRDLLAQACYPHLLFVRGLRTDPAARARVSPAGEGPHRAQHTSR